MRKNLKIYGYCNRGYDGQTIGIECDVRNGFPGFDIIGLPDKAVTESKDRVKTALRNSGFKFPQSRVLVSLSPASVPKTGSLLDLGIALSVLFACGKEADNSKSERKTVKIMVAGELALDGNVIQNSSALGAIQASEKLGCNLCIVPFPIQGKPGVAEAVNLTSAFLHCGEYLNSSDEPVIIGKFQESKQSIFEDVIGMNREKEILSMAASGFHSMLIFGPPGVGKTMLSGKIGKLLPYLSEKETEEITRIYGCAGLEITNPECPVSRIVSHDCSPIQFTGGSNSKSPGIGALCHSGVLVLDEITKYSPSLLESVKETYDKGITASSRSGEEITYPARFLMIANLNPCSCGGLGSHSTVCTCTSQKINNHWKRLGRPLVERFDIRLPVPEYDMSKLMETENLPDSYYLEKIRISADRQRIRYKKIENINFNGEIHFVPATLDILKKETEMYGKIRSNANNPANARELISIVALARTIADYSNRDEVTEEDFSKAEKLRKYGNGDFYWKVMNM